MTKKQFITKYRKELLYCFDSYYYSCIDEVLTQMYNDLVIEEIV